MDENDFKALSPVRTEEAAVNVSAHIISRLLTYFGFHGTRYEGHAIRD
jgi:hypothetical protein